MTPNTTPLPASGSDEFWGRFRYAAAGFLKNIILARLKFDKSFLTDKAYKQWKLDKLRFDNVAPEQLLRQARTQLEKIERDFVGNRDSIAAPEDEGERREQLLEDVIGFTTTDDLAGAIKLLRQGESVEWEPLARWDLLPKIRKALDFLPVPTAPSDSEQPVTQTSNDSWSEANSKKYWAKKFRVTTKTLSNWIKSGKIATDPLSPRKIRIRLDDLPRQ